MSNIATEIVARKLKRLRVMAFITQEEMANKLGVSRTSVVNIESARQNINVNQIADWCIAAGASEQEFFGTVSAINDPVLLAIDDEVERAKVHGERFTSLHEAYAVILEELDEVWDICRQKRKDRDTAALRKELVQLGAMAVKALNSMENFAGGDV